MSKDSFFTFIILSKIDAIYFLSHYHITHFISKVSIFNRKASCMLGDFVSKPLLLESSIDSIGFPLWKTSFYCIDFHVEMKKTKKRQDLNPAFGMN
jgi:hypothetical protein